MDWGSVLDVLGLGATVASGGIFGLIGSGIGAVVKIFHRKEEFKREKWRGEHELILLDKHIERRAAETENEVKLLATEGSYAGLGSSIHHDQGLKGTPFTDAIKSLFRPALTVMLLVCTMWLYLDLVRAIERQDNALRTIFDYAELKEIVRYIVYSVVFSTSTAVVWWFGDRALAPPGEKNK